MNSSDDIQFRRAVVGKKESLRKTPIFLIQKVEKTFISTKLSLTFVK